MAESESVPGFKAAIEKARRQAERVKDSEALHLLDRAEAAILEHDYAAAGWALFMAGQSVGLAAAATLIDKGREAEQESMQQAASPNLYQNQRHRLRFHVFTEAVRLRSKGMDFGDVLAAIIKNQTALALRAEACTNNRPLKVTRDTLREWMLGAFPESDRPKRGRPKKKK